MNSAQIESTLAKSAKGVPIPDYGNVVYVLQHDPMFHGARIWYDEFLDRVFIANSPIREWRDEDDTRVTVEITDTYGMRRLSSHVVRESVMYVARQRTRHCVRDWLTSLIWDDVPRIETAFEDYWGTAGDEYTRAASRNFFIGLVARILKPGCKLDTMCVFEGPQGIKKSSALEVLGGEWYSASHETVGSKDFLQGLRGKWLMEIAELQSFARADKRAIKNTLSTRNDDYRKSHGRNVRRYPRECVFAGTTNADDWGDDESGLRRFWPIACGDINLELLSAAKDQLFAESVSALTAGSSWWEMPASAADVQSDRQSHDEWTTKVRDYLDEQTPHAGVRVIDILVNGMKVHIGACGKAEQMRVARILKLDQWERRKQRKGERTDWMWFKRENITEVGNSENIEIVP